MEKGVKAGAFVLLLVALLVFVIGPAVSGNAFWDRWFGFGSEDDVGIPDGGFDSDDGDIADEIGFGAGSGSGLGESVGEDKCEPSGSEVCNVNGRAIGKTFGEAFLNSIMACGANLDSCNSDIYASNFPDLKKKCNDDRWSNGRIEYHGPCIASGTDIKAESCKPFKCGVVVEGRVCMFSMDCLNSDGSVKPNCATSPTCGVIEPGTVEGDWVCDSFGSEKASFKCQETSSYTKLPGFPDPLTKSGNPFDGQLLNLPPADKIQLPIVSDPFDGSRKGLPPVGRR